jgi:hypothetical protein
VYKLVIAEKFFRGYSNIFKINPGKSFDNIYGPDIHKIEDIYDFQPSTSKLSLED